MGLTNLQAIVTISGTIIAIVGGVFSFVKFYSDKREITIREWQKVVIHKLISQVNPSRMAFGSILEKYRSEAQAFSAYDLRKSEISEDSLRRVLLELVSSSILSMEPNNYYKLNIIEKKLSESEKVEKLNSALVKLIGSHPYKYTLDEASMKIEEEINIQWQLIKNTLKQSIDAGFLEKDANDKIAFPQK